MALLALAAAVGVTVASCASSPSPTPAATTSPGWARVDRALAGLGPDVGFLAARVSSSGSCQPVHAVAASTPRPTASQFKLFVLGALAGRIAAGTVSWGQALTVEDASRSLGNGPGTGSLEFDPTGTAVTVEEAATKMISISDNTAADMLTGLVGRAAVEAQLRRWSAHATLDEPFLTPKEVLALHYVDFPALADRYLATPGAARAAFLASEVDPLPWGDGTYSPAPRDVDTIEWFASPDDVCRAFAGLLRQSRNPRLAPLSTVMSSDTGGIGLRPSRWHTPWFKGGSEPGVLTLGYLVTDRHGVTSVVEAMVSNPRSALPADSITSLVAVAKEAFGLLG